MLVRCCAPRRIVTNSGQLRLFVRSITCRHQARENVVPTGHVSADDFDRPVRWQRQIEAMDWAIADEVKFEKAGPGEARTRAPSPTGARRALASNFHRPWRQSRSSTDLAREGRVVPGAEKIHDSSGASWAFLLRRPPRESERALSHRFQIKDGRNSWYERHSPSQPPGDDHPGPRGQAGR